jgi:hypothetical protein
VKMKHLRAFLIVCSLVVILPPLPGLAQQNPVLSQGSLHSAPVERDGQHDFDWAIGSWKIHLKRLMRPLTGSTEWVEFDGRVVCRKVWDGAELEEFEATSSDTHTHLHWLTLRLYNPASHQWSIYGVNADQGTLGLPATIGQFSGDHGEFFDQEDFQGRAILVRFVWSNTTASSPHLEQSFSTDGGKAWEVNWITDQARVQGESDKTH